MNLFQMASDYLRVLEVSDQFDEETLKDTLESIEGPLEEKMANYVKLIKSIEADVAAIKVEEDRLKKLKDSKNKTIDKLKETLLWAVEATGEETGTGTKKIVMKNDIHVKSVWVQRNPPKVEILDENLVPKKYKVPQPPKIDSKAILAAMKENEKLKIKGVQVTRGLGVRYN